jgi:hypothetical protein
MYLFALDPLRQGTDSSEARRTEARRTCELPVNELTTVDDRKHSPLVIYKWSSFSS